MKKIGKVTFMRREYIDKYNYIESLLTRCFIDFWYSSDEKLVYFKQNETKVFVLDADVILNIEN